ncbi:DNA methyltransferase, partial [Brevundimonas sp.]|uniref:DNA methyltransferase n=1 Tax=Brevundimonas sp. TaxID=1871086 RepID=UPI0028A787D9
MIQHHPNRSIADLRRKFVRRLAHRAPSYSGVGASGKPGAVQTGLAFAPPTGTGVKLNADDLFEAPLEQAQIDFENEGGETYICGNPPYLGSTWQDSGQKADLKAIFEGRSPN